MLGATSAAIIIISRQNFDLRAVDTVGLKGGHSIGANSRSDACPQWTTIFLAGKFGKVQVSRVDCAQIKTRERRLNRSLEV